MKRIAAALSCIALLGLAQPGHAEVGLNINVGIPVRAISPIPVPPLIVLPAPPEFILPPALGFYAAVGVPYDLFLLGKTYYLYRDNAWYNAPYYNGPWQHIESRQLPPGLRKHKYEQIRYYRDEEYSNYQDDQDGYRGRHFKPDKEWKEDRREEKKRRKAERRYEKEDRERGKGHHHGEDDDD